MTPSSARRAASAGVDGSASTSTKAPSRDADEDLAQHGHRERRPDASAARRAPHWRGRTRRPGDPLTSGVVRRAPVPGRLEPRRDRLEPARLDLDRFVADALLRGPAARVARPSRIATRERARPGAVLAEHERIRPAQPIPGVGDRARQRGPEDRVRLRARSGSRRRDPDARPRPGSSRHRGRTAPAP